ncbi:hypothetical protein Tco_0659211 [Tanacetum coccineum]
MANLKFVDTHNMVAFLSKPTESEGFEQIMDFLNANPIKYALTINPTIYISCIEQFWSTVKAKTVNGEVQVHALVVGNKVIITESTVRRDLQLEDVEGVDCLPNATIFEQLALMGVLNPLEMRKVWVRMHLKQGRDYSIDADDDITLVNVQDDADKEMFDVDALAGEEVFVVGQNKNVVKEVVDAAQVSTATITIEEITLAQALDELITSKPKVKGIVFQEPAEIDEEERISRAEEEKTDESNITWDDIQAKVDADYQLAERLQSE